jgi:hypothetical protein
MPAAPDNNNNYSHVDDLSSSSSELDEDDVIEVDSLSNSVSIQRPAVYVMENGMFFTDEQVDGMSSLESSVASLTSPTRQLPDILDSIARIEHMMMIGQTGPAQMAYTVHSSSSSSQQPSNTLGLDWSTLFQRALGGSNQQQQQQLLDIFAPMMNLFNLASQFIESRQFSLDGQSVVFLSGITFTQDEYEEAQRHFNNICHIIRRRQTFELRPSVNILNVILEMWHISQRSTWPMLGEVVSAILEEIDTSTLQEVPVFIMHNLIMHWIAMYGYVPSQSVIEYIYQYFLLHQQYPDEQELAHFINNIQSFMRNPEEFHAGDKQLVPALGVERIPRYTNEDKDAICCVCQDEIQVGQLVLKIPSCSHIFHAEGSACLDGSCVLDWLARSNLCPLCKTKVEVPS